jgi:FlaA1/EpsC-like NDP-sugar epimerase
MNLEVKGFLDDDPEKRGAVIHGIRVLGSTQDLPRLVKELEISQVVITIAQISRQEILHLIGLCRKIQVGVRIIPGLYDVLQGKVHVTRIRNVQIEDLLGREPIYLDEAQLGQFLGGKRVMVTGAGGSIGSELVRQVARFGPSKLLLVERAEFALFGIDGEMRRTRPDVEVVPLVADICDEARMRVILSAQAPQIVFHAAAHKHVPLMEANPGEAIKNNILATRLLGELSAEHGVETFVMISTDKAVRPTSIMGATKRFAELCIQDLAKRFPSTRYVAVRFGNVIGSAGSVVPIFREQIRRGGPVTVTHPEMRRYFMTIPESAQLVLQAGAMGEGGEIFILDMGDPVRILDLAEEMITLTGLRPYVDMDIEFTGLRPGEKLFEELELSGEQIAKTRHPKIYIGKLNAYPPDQVQRALGYFDQLARDGDGTAVRKFLNSLLPEANLGVRRTSRQDTPTAEETSSERPAPSPQAS